MIRAVLRRMLRAPRAFTHSAVVGR
jgi:hypothetical protein